MSGSAPSNFDPRSQTVQQTIPISLQIQQVSMQTLVQIKDLLLGFQTLQLQASHRNPLNRFGRKCFSQTDEDGITLEIVRRLGIEEGVYAEFGVGDGLENNTLVLAALGWCGFWVGAEKLAFDYSKATRFTYVEDWITLENVLAHANSGLEALGADRLDVVSLDLDGNDIYFVDALLSGGVEPKLFIVEYNAKFMPPTKFQITYDPQHRWTGDDYFGAAITNFVEMFERHGYRLVCCNSHTGANAFFIRGDCQHLFEDVPRNIDDLYVPPRYFLYGQHGHPRSKKVVEALINR
jgi:hypothetical protein